eukprot:CAMPEP_0194582840 /NCGR_PEP_ID=MMETSP0292-20121207/15908_1 /TAXON_ID=39354 /ORGANISM="Heterosigma akashiwo, Strain CCMP2393" /LENGTH=168 /DNA_ID=CAMNT_0039437197 /DNA_START=189 /DNA_END=693 /DNA_ORIENTATION=-
MKHAPPTTAGHRIHPTLAAARTKQKPRLPPALAPASAARPRPRSEPPAPSPAAARPRRAGEPPPRPDAHGSERGAAALPPRLSPGPRPAAHLGSHVDVLPLVPGEGGASTSAPAMFTAAITAMSKFTRTTRAPLMLAICTLAPAKVAPPRSVRLRLAPTKFAAAAAAA